MIKTSLNQSISNYSFSFNSESSQPPQPLVTDFTTITAPAPHILVQTMLRSGEFSSYGQVWEAAHTTTPY